MITIEEKMLRDDLFSALAMGVCIIGNTVYSLSGLTREDGSGNCWILHIQPRYNENHHGKQQTTFIRTEPPLSELTMDRAIAKLDARR